MLRFRTTRRISGTSTLCHEDAHNIAYTVYDWLLSNKGCLNIDVISFMLSDESVIEVQSVSEIESLSAV